MEFDRDILDANTKVHVSPLFRLRLSFFSRMSRVRDSTKSRDEEKIWRSHSIAHVGPLPFRFPLL